MGEERNSAASLIGMTLNQYNLEKLIKETDRSWVFKAKDPSLNREVALKILKPDQGIARKEQFLTEGKKLAALEKHKNITTVYAAGKDQGLHYMAMEHVRGEDLEDLIKSKKTFSFKEILEIMFDVGEAISHAHSKGIKHQDIKLANIKRTDEGSGGVYVLDFGGRLTVDKDGSPTAGRGTTNDVTAIGIVAQKLLEHREKPEKGIPKKLEKIVEKATSSEFDSPEEFKQAIIGYKHGITRRKFLKITAGAAALLGLGYLGFRHWDYVNSIDYLVEKIAETEATNYNKIDPLFKELDLKIFEKKIKRIDKKIPKGEFPFGTIHSGELYSSKSINYANGFWSGILWEGYEKTKDQQFREWAEERTSEIKLASEDSDFTTAVRFFYSHAKGFDTLLKVDGKERKEFKSQALSALDLLVKRFDHTGQFIPIIKETYLSEAATMMDVVPFLWWGYEKTGNSLYADIAKAHVNTTIKYNFREDGSVTKTAIFDPKQNKKLREENSIGYTDQGSVSRIQAQALLGLVETFRVTKDSKILRLIESSTNYFLKNLPKDKIPKYDFTAPENALKDSSALAIEECALQKLYKITGNERWKNLSRILRKALIINCLSTEKDPECGVLKHGCLNAKKKRYEDSCLIFGDYYFLNTNYA